MKRLVYFLVILLTLVLSFSIVSCSDECTEHVDKNEDYLCDACGAELDKPDPEPPLENLKLIEDGKVKFQIVLASGCGTKTKSYVEKFAKDMKKLGYEIDVVDDEDDNVKDCEILIGDVISRGDKYNYDEHTLGLKGYVVTSLDSKIIITGGNGDLILKQVENFFEAAFPYDNANKDDLVNVAFSDEYSTLYVQDDYRIPGITFDGEDMRAYTIAADASDTPAYNAAKLLQETLYARAGYWLNIVPTTDADKSIVIKTVAKTDEDGNGGPAGKDGFIIRGASDGKLNVYCAYENAFDSAMRSFIAIISIKTEEIKFESGKTYFTKEVSVVRYEDYEELTDNDKTNDFEALIEVHDYANEGGQPVYAQSGMTYYISETGGKQIVIKTDCYFGNAKFIIDDSFITRDSKYAKEAAHVFKIASDYAPLTYNTSYDPYGIVARLNERDGIKTTDTSLPLNLGYDALIVPYDNSRIMYNRSSQYGDTASGGHPQHEPILVFADNKIDRESRPLFDFAKVDNILIYRADERPITISGGKFTTIATRTDMITLNRGIAINRSNVTIDGMDHYVDNQPLGAAPHTDENGACYNSGGPNYNGWLVPSGCNNLTVINTKLCGRTHYRQGSYDIGGGNMNKMVFINCTQYNMWRDESKKIVYNETEHYWGIMGTSYCKNIEYRDSMLSRLDAHAGVFNVKVSGCEMRSICGVGGGDFIVENTTVYGSSLMGFRVDYGSTWRGDVYLKNCKIVANGGAVTLINGGINNAPYGFNTVLPYNIYVENVTHSRGENFSAFYLFGYDVAAVYQLPGDYVNKFEPTQNIVIKQPRGYEFTDIEENKYPNVVLYLNVKYLPFEEE